jgi:hypothetical protein
LFCFSCFVHFFRFLLHFSPETYIKRATSDTRPPLRGGRHALEQFRNLTKFTTLTRLTILTRFANHTEPTNSIKRRKRKTDSPNTSPREGNERRTAHNRRGQKETKDRQHTYVTQRRRRKTGNTHTSPKEGNERQIVYTRRREKETKGRQHTPVTKRRKRKTDSTYVAEKRKRKAGNTHTSPCGTRNKAGLNYFSPVGYKTCFSEGADNASLHSFLCSYSFKKKKESKYRRHTFVRRGRKRKACSTHTSARKENERDTAHTRRREKEKKDRQHTHVPVWYWQQGWLKLF